MENNPQKQGKRRRVKNRKAKFPYVSYRKLTQSFILFLYLITLIISINYFLKENQEQAIISNCIGFLILAIYTNHLVTLKNIHHKVWYYFHLLIVVMQFIILFYFT